MSIKLSLLDQQIVYEGRTAQETLAQSLAFAKLADDLGYSDFLVAEHHLGAGTAGPAPEVLSAYILANTSRIRVGSGGVMLQHYNPFKVAEQFSLLSLLAPGRVILGVGKAQGGIDTVVEVLQDQYKQPRPNFEVLYEDLLHSLRADHPIDHPFAHADYTLYPKAEVLPDVTLLGGSVESARLAAQTNTNIIYAYFGNSDENQLKAARQVFKENLPQGSNASFQVAVFVNVTEDEALAQEYERSLEAYTVTLHNGKRINFNSEQSSIDYLASHQGKGEIIARRAGVVAGNSEKVRDQLLAWQAAWEVDHFIIHTAGIDYMQKFAMIEVLAEVLNLKGV